MTHSAIVIGTGFGGAVTACRLAQAGVAVKVLERGRRYDRDPKSYPRGVFDEWVWSEQRGIFDIQPISEMQIIQAAGYGGGSLIYANVHLRPPPEAFAEGWPAGYTREALDPHYDLVAYMLDIKSIDASPLGIPVKAQRMHEVAEGLGRKDSFFLPPLAVNFGPEEARPNKFGVMQGGCTHCGECVIGCKPRAKNTLDRNYLAIAEGRGATMLTECEVVEISPRDGAPGYRVTYLDHAHGGQLRFEEAEYLFLCAGAVNSTALLLKARATGRLPRISERLGARYSGNGDLAAFAFDTGKRWEPASGPTITTGLLYDGKADATKGWFVVEEGGFTHHLWPLFDLIRPTHPWLTPTADAGPRPNGAPSGAARDPMGGPMPGEPVPEKPAPAAPAEGETARAPTPAEIAEAFRKKAQATMRPEGAAHDPGAMNLRGMANTALFLAMGRDLANGRIELGPDNVPRVRWDVASNLQLYSLQERLMQDMVSQLQGTYATTPFWRFAHLPVSVHNLGGCAMGKSREDGVTSDVGEVFEYPNLFVIDGGILPGATGVNPSHTIAAVAERNIEQVIRRITGDPSWAPPERRFVSPFHDPLAALLVPPEGTPPPVKPALGMALHEHMEGTWELAGGGPRRAAASSLEITIQDIAEFLSDPTHMGIATGTLTLEGFTAGHAAVTNGIWNLLVPHGEGREREVRYMLPFQGADGRVYTLDGAKVFRPNVGPALWSESATLDFQIHLGPDRNGPVVARGALELGLLGAVDLAASIREFGPYSAFEKAQALVEFLEFYFGTLAKVSWLLR